PGLIIGKYPQKASWNSSLYCCASSGEPAYKILSLNSFNFSLLVQPYHSGFKNKYWIGIGRNANAVVIISHSFSSSRNSRIVAKSVTSSDTFMPNDSNCCWITTIILYSSNLSLDV